MVQVIAMDVLRVLTVDFAVFFILVVVMNILSFIPKIKGKIEEMNARSKMGVIVAISSIVFFPWLLAFFLNTRRLDAWRERSPYQMLFFAVLLTTVLLTFVCTLLLFSTASDIREVALMIGFDLLVTSIVFLGFALKEKGDRGGDDDCEEPVPDDPSPYGDAVDRILRSGILVVKR